MNNPTNAGIALLIIITVVVLIGVVKLLALSYEANKSIPGTFDVDWGRK